jgi:hypothetical protein
MQGSHSDMGKFFMAMPQVPEAIFSHLPVEALKR